MSKEIKQNKRRKAISLFHLNGIIGILLALIIILGLIGYALILYGGKLVVNKQDLILDATTIIETSDGKLIGKLYNENRLPVDIEHVPKHVQQAFTAIEDRRFFDHAGIDFKSVVRAVYRDIVAGGKVEGASTITQQLAKNLFLYNDKTWMRKTKEVMAAIYLEKEFSKERILELYMNQIYYGHGIYGIEAASQLFFSKSVEDLSIAEGALLAGLAQAPNGYSPIKHPEKALKRRNIVLKAMEDAGVISTEKRLQEQGKTLGLQIQEVETKPWVDSYIDLVMKEAAETYNLSIHELKRGGYRIVTNMDEAAQRIAYEQFKQNEYFPGNTDGVQGSFVMKKQKTGEVVAVIGGRDYHLGDLNRSKVKRQPGSTIKPIAVYGPAMMTDKYHAYSLIPDNLYGNDGYHVSNADGQYDGIVSVYYALMQSKNTSAVWLLDQIGIEYAKKYLEKMGMNIPDDGLAIALGGLQDGVTPLNMADAYGTFANNGKMVTSYAISRIYDQQNNLLYQANPVVKEVFTPQVAWDMTQILASTVKDGTAKAGNYPKALAGKTGTTQHPFASGKSKDAWFVGYTPEYVTALWMGYDHSDKDHYLEGGSSFPTELTKKILTEIDKLEPLVAEFTKPAHVQDLPNPIVLPEISNLHASYTFGGLTLIKGRLTWKGSDDERVVYRIYRKKAGIDERIGEVLGETEYVIDKVNLFQTNYYYIVPYDPLTNMEGIHSDLVELSL